MNDELDIIKYIAIIMAGFGIGMFIGSIIVFLYYFPTMAIPIVLLMIAGFIFNSVKNKEE